VSPDGISPLAASGGQGGEEDSMRNSFVGVVALTVFGVFAGGPLHAQAVTGTVVYEGKVPNLRPIAMDADPVCAKKHTSPVLSELLVLGPGQTMANVIVSVTKGLPAGKTYPAPKEPVTMDQHGCQYIPHVLGVMVGQPFKILNSDGLLHNVHALPKVNGQFNEAMPPTRKEAVETFTKSEGVFQIKCDVHPWMQSYVEVFPHPFYAITKADGKFSISGLEPGTYTLEAWHEKLGTQTATVTVGKDMKPVAFKFTAPAAAAK
jgi:plastocyanin